MSQPSGGADKELEAIGTILRALDGLEGESIQRVLDYVVRRLSLSRPITMSAVSIETTAPSVPSGATGRPRQPSIRDLKEEKKPESANQMAALVAYYLSEVAPDEERKPVINASDIEKLFKQAGFKLPKSLHMTLPNAAAAGYLDSVGNGTYKLNPVGYNLIAHALPREHLAGTSSTKRRSDQKRSRR